MWHKPCRTFHPWCLCIKTRCLWIPCGIPFLNWQVLIGATSVGCSVERLLHVLRVWHVWNYLPLREAILGVLYTSKYRVVTRGPRCSPKPKPGILLWYWWTDTFLQFFNQCSQLTFSDICCGYLQQTYQEEYMHEWVVWTCVLSRAPKTASQPNVTVDYFTVSSHNPNDKTASAFRHESRLEPVPVGLRSFTSDE